MFAKLKNQKISILSITILLIIIVRYICTTYDQSTLNDSLILAIKSKDNNSVKVLLCKGANANARDYPHYKNFGYFEYIFTHLNNQSSDDTALMITATQDDYEIAKLLIEYHADVNAQNRFGETAMMKALPWNYASVVIQMIQSGANIDEILASIRSDTKSSIIVNDNFRFDNATHPSTMSESIHKKIITVLLEHGADLNIKSKLKWTALMAAAGGGHLESVVLLLRNHATVNDKDKIGKTALSWAARSGQYEIVKLLIDNGADKSIKDNYGTTAEEDALAKGHSLLAKSLLNSQSR